MSGARPARERVAALITAAGSSTRMGGIKKEYRPLSVDGSGTLTVIGSSVAVFAESGLIDAIILVVPAGGESEARKAIPDRYLVPGARPAIRFASGGPSRRASVHNGLKLASEQNLADYVLIHDGARPWIDQDLVSRLVAAVAEQKAVIPVLPLVETPKELDSKGCIVRHLKRASIVSAQTPQAFELAGILAAHEQAAAAERSDGIEFTDDAEVWGAYAGPVRTLPGSQKNKKITFPEDLPAAETGAGL